MSEWLDSTQQQITAVPKAEHLTLLITLTERHHTRKRGKRTKPNVGKCHVEATSSDDVVGSISAELIKE